MSKRSSDIAQRMRQVALHNKPAAAGTTGAAGTAEVESQDAPLAPVQPAAPAARERRIRYTLDLSPEQHRFLKRFAFEAEVDASAIARALLTELDRDFALAERVRGQVRRDGD